MPEPDSGLTLEQIRAMDALAGSLPADGLIPDRGAVADWLLHSPDFIAGLDRAKSHRTERLRAEVRSLATEAVSALRNLITGSDIPPAVRLRAALAILGAAGALTEEAIGPTSAEEVRAEKTDGASWTPSGSDLPDPPGALPTLPTRCRRKRP